MKYRSLFLGLLFLMAVSCSVNELDQMDRSIRGDDDDIVFSAIIDEQPEAETKVYADEKLRVLWNSDDRITIFNKITFNQEFYFTGDDGDNAGSFKKVSTDEFVTGNPLDGIFAVYPYLETTKIDNDGSVITSSFSPEQTYKENSFGVGANLMVSATGDNMLRFKNVGGYLSFKFFHKGVSVSSITLRGNKGEKLSGPCTIAISSGTPVATMSSGANDQVTLTCETPVALGATESDAVQFIFVLPPVALSGGFTVTITTPDGSVFEKSSTRAIEIGRSAITKMGAMEVVPVMPDDHDNIVFADPAVKAICVDKWDTNGDGELSFEEAEIVTDLGDAFEANRDIRSFNELYYFFGLKEIANSAFRACSNLASIDIPDTVTKIGLYAFNGAGITSLHISSAVNEIENYAFVSCSKLEYIEVEEDNTVFDSRDDCNAIIETASNTLVWGCKNSHIPDGITKLGGSAFYGCSGLNSIDIPESVTTIESSVFMGSNLTSIFIPASVTSIVGSQFNNCENLERITVASGNTVYDSRNDCNAIIDTERGMIISTCQNTVIPDGVTVIGQGTFSDNTYLESIDIPESITNIGQTAFTGCKSLVSVVLPSTVKELGIFAFSFCPLLSSITIKAVTPPTIPSFKPIWPFSSVSADFMIYVPEGSVDIYKATWDKYADNIQPIPPTGMINGHAYVDMGNGLKWATMNIGASTPLDYGDYFAWGETGPKTVYSSDNYLPGGSFVDAASENWGGSWRMPTYKEWETLISTCTLKQAYKAVDDTQVFIGYNLVASNGNSIFFPATGYKSGTEMYLEGVKGYYWSSTDSSMPECALSVFLDAEEFWGYEGHYIDGFAIRPVSK